MPAPVVIQPVPPQIVNEQAAYGPLDLKTYISATRFKAELADGQSLPRGLICTQDGIFTGIPAKGTQGNYEIKVSAENDEGAIPVTIILTIKPSLSTSEGDYVEQAKTEIWEALAQNLPVPDLGELYDRPITAADIYYLLERWATLIIWDAFNLDPVSEKQLLHLEGENKHFNIYDRGSCLVATPKDLYSHERTLEDALTTSRVMAREVYKRGWTIEVAGFEKMVRAAWVELQLLGDKNNKYLEILRFEPTLKELQIYKKESLGARLGMSHL